MTINSYFSNGSFAMNKPDTEIKRCGIVVIQSLYPNDVKTGEILYHDVLQYKEYHKRESFHPFMMSIPQMISIWQYRTLKSHCRRGLFLPYNSRPTAVTKVSVSIIEKFLSGRISTTLLDLSILKQAIYYLW